jgi:hypothetical protein
MLYALRCAICNYDSQQAAIRVQDVGVATPKSASHRDT